MAIFLEIFSPRLLLRHTCAVICNGQREKSVSYDSREANLSAVGMVGGIFDYICDSLPEPELIVQERYLRRYIVDYLSSGAPQERKELLYSTGAGVPERQTFHMVLDCTCI